MEDGEQYAPCSELNMEASCLLKLCGVILDQIIPLKLSVGQCSKVGSLVCAPLVQVGRRSKPK